MAWIVTTITMLNCPLPAVSTWWQFHSHNRLGIRCTLLTANTYRHHLIASFNTVDTTSEEGIVGYKVCHT